MGIQINGQTDIISASDGSLTISGANLPTVTNLNATGIVTATSFSGSGSALTGVGKILRVVQATTTDTASGTTANTDVDVFSAAITPTQSDSNIFVMINFGLGHGNNQTWYLKRGSTKIAGTGKSSTFIHTDSFFSTDEDSVHDYAIIPTHYQFLDTGRTAGTSQITYTLGCRLLSTSMSFYFNRARQDASTSAAYTATFILMEVAA